MLSYQHGYHAGNRADVLKHAVLHAVLEEEAKAGKPLLYVETHSARGFYDLTGDKARKTGEADLGVLAMPKADKAARALQPWLRHVQGKGPKSYPGSPALAVQLLGPSARIALFEKHPAEHAALAKALAKEPRALIRKEDGYRGALRLQPRRGEEMLVMLDPSYETEADMDALANWVPRAMMKWPKARFLIWLPLFADGREEEFGAFLSELDEGFVAGSRWARRSQDPSALEGSAMIGLRISGPAAKRAFAIAAELDKLWA
ncbi:23S rRNA (adenine(2030)-N(6))-methyltransferase RlmJ [Hyphomonas sp. FCG-A18]|uniref:23S rRNA (adenine(2030)-N(6))-methyltransferase RlmJ n=1 Tax=Hyphomonas sp. FCG-A18 TaxID=3080019 RepID=UPI002B2F2DA1|nr:23S rRNA (adenine(2030)-N(6))-methyltransferase RlmJ [Hyphomonas sp. FCG-A18]